MRFAAAAFVVVISASSCGGGALEPVAFDAAREPCTFCRMTGSSGRFAAQIVSRTEEPRFFDDIGCLRSHLKKADTQVAATQVFVADHRTGAWIRADQAVFTEQPDVPTPMGSHLVAHESGSSRDQDPAIRGGTPKTRDEVFGVTLKETGK